MRGFFTEAPLTESKDVTTTPVVCLLLLSRILRVCSPLLACLAACISHGRVLALHVPAESAVRQGPVFAALVVTEPPAHINIVHIGSVHLEVAIQLRLVLATKLSASMPSYADVVRVCAVLNVQPSKGQSCRTAITVWSFVPTDPRLLAVPFMASFMASFIALCLF